MFDCAMFTYSQKRWGSGVGSFEAPTMKTLHFHLSQWQGCQEASSVIAAMSHPHHFTVHYSRYDWYTRHDYTELFSHDWQQCSQAAPSDPEPSLTRAFRNEVLLLILF